MNARTSLLIWTAPVRGLPVRGLHMLVTPRGRIPGVIFANDEAARKVEARLQALSLTEEDLARLLSSPSELQEFLHRILADCAQATVPPEVTRLLETLDVLGWNQAKLARKLQVDPNTVSRWVTGRSPVPAFVLEYLGALKAVKDLANALDL